MLGGLRREAGANSADLEEGVEAGKGGLGKGRLRAGGGVICEGEGCCSCCCWEAIAIVRKLHSLWALCGRFGRQKKSLGFPIFYSYMPISAPQQI